MTDTGEPLEKRQERLERARSGNESRRRRLSGVAVAVAVILAVAGFVYFMRFADRGSGGYAPASGTQDYSNDTFVSIPVPEAGPTAKFFTYDANGTTVRFFLVKGTDGSVRCAADACDVCYPAHKGYSQSGQDMRCNNCGKVFSINDIGTKNTAGGCWPSRIPIKAEGGMVHIARADLGAKTYLFS